MRDYEFGEYIYNLRKQKGLSQAELGTLVGVSNKAVSKWETGEAKPAIMQLKNLSKIFNISIIYKSYNTCHVFCPLCHFMIRFKYCRV